MNMKGHTMATDEKKGLAAAPVEEGPRSFLKFLNEIANGEVESEGSYLLHTLGQRLQEEAAVRNGKVKGKLTLTITFTTDETGTTSVFYDIDKKEPKRKTTPALFWLTKHGNMSVTNPRQLGLALREVPPLDRGRREVQDDDKKPREA